jgi:hypothetical protein
MTNRCPLRSPVPIYTFQNIVSLSNGHGYSAGSHMWQNKQNWRGMPNRTTAALKALEEKDRTARREQTRVVPAL